MGRRLFRWRGLHPGSLALDTLSDLACVMEGSPLGPMNPQFEEPSDLAALAYHLQRLLPGAGECECEGVAQIGRKVVPRQSGKFDDWPQSWIEQNRRDKALLRARELGRAAAEHGACALSEYRRRSISITVMMPQPPTAAIMIALHLTRSRRRDRLGC